MAIHVVPQGQPAAAFAGLFEYPGFGQTRQEIANELRAEAERMALEIGVHLSFVVERGDVTRAVSSVAKELNSELVAVGRSTKPLHEITGALGHRLTRRHDAPVVVVVP